MTSYLLLQDGTEGPIKLHFNNYKDGKVGKPETIEVDVVIGADGANSRVAKEIDAGDYDYAIAFQVGQSLSRLLTAECLNTVVLEAVPARKE